MPVILLSLCLAQATADNTQEIIIRHKEIITQLKKINENYKTTVNTLIGDKSSLIKENVLLRDQVANANKRADLIESVYSRWYHNGTFMTVIGFCLGSATVAVIVGAAR